MIPMIMARFTDAVLCFFCPYVRLQQPFVNENLLSFGNIYERIFFLPIQLNI